jgi:hypothetical protein
MINPSLDIWVWVACLVLLATLGARAWVVETGQGRLGRTPVQVKVLTGAVVVVIVGLFGLLAMQGGVLLVESLVNGTDPSKAYYGNNDATNPPPADPAAPPAGAPPAGAPPAGAPAPPAPGG